MRPPRSTYPGCGGQKLCQRQEPRDTDQPARGKGTGITASVERVCAKTEKETEATPNEDMTQAPPKQLWTRN